MASYKIVPKPSVEKDLRSISKPTLRRVMRVVEGLGNDPLPRQTMKLEGADDLYRVRVGNYRIIYEIDRRGKQVIIHHVRHRREVYRKL